MLYSTNIPCHHVLLLVPLILHVYALLKCLVINLRLEVNNCDNGLVVHVLEAAMNVLPIPSFSIMTQPGALEIQLEEHKFLD